MKALFLTIALACAVSHQAGAQITHEQVKGVWSIAAMGKTGEDSVVTFEKDSILFSLFKNKTFTDISVLTEKASSQEEKMAYMFLDMFRKTFFQFDGKGVFGEGMLEDNKETAPKVRTGTYKLNGNKLTTTTKKTDEYTVEAHGAYLIVNMGSGMVMYLKKTSDKLY